MDAPPPRYYLMIVGIDNYVDAANALSGCVNDAVAVAELLVRQGVSAQAVTEGLFLAPRDGRAVSLPFRAPTRANLIARLEQLAAGAAPGDHVWIYYSGHGTQRFHPDPRSSALFEALVPVDFTAQGSNLLYDFEIARLLQQIGRGATVDSITVVLDCCNSAGATRKISPPGTLDADSAPGADRFIELSPAQLVALPLPAVDAMERTGIANIGDQHSGQPTLIAACHADEKAREDAATGTYHGVLTSTLLKLLDGYAQHGRDLHTLRWADIWQELRQEVKRRNAAQQPWFIGPLGRPCLGGRGVPYDAGIALGSAGTAPDVYRLDAGGLLGIREGSLIAVYEVDPPLFAPLNSVLDLRQRVGTLRVEQVGLLEALARPQPGAAFVLPRAARARLISANLSVYLAPSAAPHLDVAALTAAAAARFLQVQLVDAAAAELQVERLPDGSYGLGDAVNPPAASADGALPIATLPGNQRAEVTRELLIDAFLHYAQYVIPLRMARLAAQGGKSVLGRDALQVDLIDCAGLNIQELSALHENQLPRVPLVARPDGVYELRVPSMDVSDEAPDLFCIRLRNHTKFSLFVSVFDCNVDGQLEELLLNEQLPDGRVGKLIWMFAHCHPYDLRLSGQRRRGTDRLVIVASTVKGGHGLESLHQQRALQECFASERNVNLGPDAAGQDRPTFRSPSVSNAVTSWTAVAVALELRLQ